MFLDARVEKPPSLEGLVPCQNPSRLETLDFSCAGAREFSAVLLMILRLLSLIPRALKLRSERALGNLALRQQLAVLIRRHRRPKLWKLDRVFWLQLSRSWEGWKETLVIVKPETVLRWHRRRFASYWTRLSGQKAPGRPGKDREIRELIRKMAVFTIATRGAQRNSGRPLLRSHNSCPAESLLPHCCSDHPRTVLQTHPARTHRFARLAAAGAVGFRVQRESARREGQARGLQEPFGRDFGEEQDEEQQVPWLKLRFHVPPDARFRSGGSGIVGYLSRAAPSGT